MVSYDASSGQLPSDPPFRFEDTGALFGTPTTPTISDGIVTLGPTSDEGRTFWYTDELVLNESTGFEISANLRLDSESSSDPSDDAGLAIAFSDSQALYQNLFINDSGVFFSKLNGENTAIVPDTKFTMNTSQWNTYTIQVLNDNVTLSVNGTPEISSTMFNLSATGQLVLPDEVALGDLAPDAQSQFDFTAFSVAVPEPTYAPATLLGIALVIGMRSRRPIPVRA
jgi:hypothetical protein